MTEPEYANSANDDIDQQNMEALVANTEQDYDVDQAVRHNIYIGWIMGLLKGKDIEALRHGGGNRLEIVLEPYHITVLIPYPPGEWQP